MPPGLTNLPPLVLREIAKHFNKNNFGRFTTVGKVGKGLRSASNNVLAKKLRNSRNFRNGIVREANRRSLRQFYRMNHERAMNNGTINRNLLGGRNTANGMRRYILMRIPNLTNNQRNVLIRYVLGLNQNRLARILFKSPAQIRINAGIRF